MTNPTTAEKKVESVQQAMEIFDKSAARTHPNMQTQAWEILRAHISTLTAELASLQRERDADMARFRSAMLHEGVPANVAASVVRILESNNG